MMGILKDEIFEVAETLDLNIKLLDKEGEQLRKWISEKYANSRTRWLWEEMENSVTLFDPQGWKLTADYVADQSNIVMFFNRGEEDAVILLMTGNQLRLLLGETTHYEYYLTNLNGTFLLCFNHHDYLIAAGDAKPWLEDIVRSRSE